MGKIILNIVLIVIVLVIVCVAWPYFSKSRVNYELKKAASYGTKHSVAETLESLTDALEERGVDFDPDNIEIEKSSKGTVTISFSYEDSISFFGIVLKKLEFDLEVTQKNVKEVF